MIRFKELIMKRKEGEYNIDGTVNLKKIVRSKVFKLKDIDIYINGNLIGFVIII